MSPKPKLQKSKFLSCNNPHPKRKKIPTLLPTSSTQKPLFKWSNKTCSKKIKSLRLNEFSKMTRITRNLPLETNDLEVILLSTKTLLIKNLTPNCKLTKFQSEITILTTQLGPSKKRYLFQIQILKNQKSSQLKWSNIEPETRPTINGRTKLPKVLIPI